MKFCENCGAQLEDDATFCEECGTKQSQNEEKPPEHKKMPVIIIICILLICAGGIFAYYYTNHSKENKSQTVTNENIGQEETQTLKDSIQWEADEEEIDTFKTQSLSDYPERKIGEAIEAVGEEVQWKNGELDNDKYFLCTFSVEEDDIALVFDDSKDSKVKIAEYFKNEQMQDDTQIKEFCEGTFVQSPEDTDDAEETEQSGNLEFIGMLDQTYKIQDNTYPAEITFSNQEGNTVDVNINISDGIYDITYYGMITSDYIVQISLDGGERINFMWDDAKTFQAVPADGFTDDSIRMMQMMCECLDNKTYTAKEEQENIQVVQPPDGKYWEGDTPPAYANYYVELSNVTEDGFDFVIYGLKSDTQDYDVVFMPHTAVYTDTYTAVYYGEQYTLTFNWQEMGYLTVEGFEEWIPSGSAPLYNNAYLGVS